MKTVIAAFFALMLFVPALCIAALPAPDVLDSESVYTDNGLFSYHVVGIKLFSTDDMDYENVDDEEMRKLKRYMEEYQETLARTLKRNLEDEGFDAYIIKEDGPDASRAEMIIEGSFTSVNLGSAAARFMFGFGAGQIGIATKGKLVDAKTGDDLAAFAHETTSGLDDRFDKWEMVGREVQDMADDIAEFIRELK